IDIFWLPGTRDDSPAGRTPTFAMTTPSIENVALRMSSPRESWSIGVKSPRHMKRRTSCMRVSSKKSTAACWSGGLSGGGVLDSTCGFMVPLPEWSALQARSSAAAPSTIAGPFLCVLAIAVLPPRTSGAREYGKTRATLAGDLYGLSRDRVTGRERRHREAVAK